MTGRHVGGGCLDENEVQAYLGGQLSEERASQIVEHVADCRACRRLLAALARFAGPPEGEGGAVTEELIGRVLRDTYRLTRLVGRGGMGAVYEAAHARLAKKRFAVKVLLPSLTGAAELFARFRREAEIVTELGHPHIVDVIDFNETENGLPYMVMEFLEGEDLGQRLRREWRLPPDEVARIIAQVASALQAAHDHGIVHRDMKPDNIFLVGPRAAPIHVKVLDFGISKIRHSSMASFVTADHQILGTPNFMSPEQAQGEAKDVDHKTDIFALGSITYYAVSGQLPFASPTLSGVLYQVCEANPRPLAELVALSPSVGLVLARALAKKKDDRYQRIEEFARDLVAALEEGTVAAAAVPKGPLLAAPTVPIPEPATGEPAPAPEEDAQASSLAVPARRIRLVMLVAGALVAVVVSTGWLLVRGRSGRRSAPPHSAASPIGPGDAGTRLARRSDAVSPAAEPQQQAASTQPDAGPASMTAPDRALAKKSKAAGEARRLQDRRAPTVPPTKKPGGDIKPEKKRRGPLFEDLAD